MPNNGRLASRTPDTGCSRSLAAAVFIGLWSVAACAGGNGGIDETPGVDPDPPDERPLPEAVSRAVGDITRACAEMEVDATTLAGDVEAGLVDHANEWEEYESARQQYLDGLAAIAGWTAELRSLITSGASPQSIAQQVESLPIGTAEGFSFDADELHQKFVDGTLEPPDFVFSGPSVAPLAATKALAFMKKYGPAILKAGKTI